jgi:hypothetical protein
VSPHRDPIRVRRLRPGRLHALAGALIALAACGTAEDATEKQLSQLRSEIVRLRANHAVLVQRLEAIEISRAAAAKAEPAQGAAPQIDRPTLEVVRLGPGAAASPEAEAVEAEPESGERIVLRSTKGGGVVEERIRDGAPATPTSKPTASAKVDPNGRRPGADAAPPRSAP